MEEERASHRVITAALWAGVLVALVLAMMVVFDDLDGHTARAVTVTPSSEGPIYDLPEDGSKWSSYVVHDKENWEWVVITRGRSIAVIPHLDAEGNQIKAENE